MDQSGKRVSGAGCIGIVVKRTCCLERLLEERPEPEPEPEELRWVVSSEVIADIFVLKVGTGCLVRLWARGQRS